MIKVRLAYKYVSMLVSLAEADLTGDLIIIGLRHFAILFYFF
jgi:hypothetical protein